MSCVILSGGRSSKSKDLIAFKNISVEAGMFFCILFAKKDLIGMICPKCGEKYEVDMPRCLWCDAPNLDHAAVMENLAAQKEAERLENAVLREKRRQECAEKFGNVLVESVQGTGISPVSVLKAIVKFLIFITIVVPNVAFLNFWLIKFFHLFANNPLLIFWGAAILSIALWLTFVIFFVKKRCGVYLRIIVMLSEFMIGFTVMEMVRKICI